MPHRDDRGSGKKGDHELGRACLKMGLHFWSKKKKRNTLTSGEEKVSTLYGGRKSGHDIARR